MKPSTKAIKHCAHVSLSLHRNDAHVVLLVDPNKEVLVVVVPDSTCVRPVTCHAGAREEWGDWLVKQEVIVNQLLLLIWCHLAQGVVTTR